MSSVCFSFLVGLCPLMLDMDAGCSLFYVWKSALLIEVIELRGIISHTSLAVVSHYLNQTGKHIASIGSGQTI